jgi:hypothetical protein
MIPESPGHIMTVSTVSAHVQDRGDNASSA